MKARVKATGKIVEVDECGQIFKNMGMDYMDTNGYCYKSEDLDFTDNTPFDYWTRLEHQAAIGAMHGLCANYTEFTKDNDGTLSNTEMITENARIIAHALMEKMKEAK